ncbi:MAG: ABC transporter permease [Burkholderiales bacterium]|nr:ABC transporter permease [Burkholderiales bacterium]
MNKYKVSPEQYSYWKSFFTLLEKEVLRFWKIGLQTILAPILMGVLYLMVFGQVLANKMPTFEGVTYLHFLVPGLVMMSLLQSAFGNSAFSLLSAKIMGSVIFIQLPPFSGWQLSLAIMGASVIRGLIVGIGVYFSAIFWSLPPLEHPLWILIFAFMGALLMAALGVIGALWADKFDQMGAFESFVIMPLTFLSGVFYSINQLPPVWQFLSKFNPFFYMIDGFRYGFFSQSDFNPWVSISVVSLFGVLFACFATWLLVIGYKIKK